MPAFVILVFCVKSTPLIKFAEAKAALAYDSAESAAMNIVPLPLFADHLPEVSIHNIDEFGCAPRLTSIPAFTAG